jgi:hypothetical protein
MNAAALRAIADAADALSRIAREALADDAPADEHLPKQKAAEIAGVKVRALDDARRRGELPMYGRQRSRTVRRDELMAWLASRRVERMAVPDALAARVERRLAKKRRAGKRAAS